MAYERGEYDPNRDLPEAEFWCDRCGEQVDEDSITDGVCAACYEDTEAGDEQ